ncbi:hypothetical protein COJ11_31625 [Bacillus cereus]|nr:MULTISPECIES: L-serine ammonia-lyase, iron-sulfur-dependent, subunit alpha [Bacillus cereus group]MCP1399757.1 L-cysteine desulfidase [Bacillus cereus]PEC73496.1 hypothetical protein CON25_11920 [Bacillus thuringiensis]PEE90398.1 hypothetical protein COM90_02345 [Bacillus thuringiensis]PEF85874.1 hypothetical protein CON51_19040 [Bacillus thuringiensis]PES51026.1 hypothetical protein CN506_25510 [Bacillus thuringiensis]
MNENKILQLLERELSIAVGCTEPVAIALAAANAKKYSKGRIKKLKVIASKNVIKNALSVGIPGTDAKGIDFVSLLGAIAGNPDKKLEVLANITSEQVNEAKQLVDEGIASVEIANSPEPLYIEVILKAEHNRVRVVIVNEHTNISCVEVNNQKIISSLENDSGKCLNNIESTIDVDSIYDFVTAIDTNKLDLIKKSIDLNYKIGLEGLNNNYGLEIGKTLKMNIEKGLLPNDLATCAMALSAAGSDARMAGSRLPVVSNSGSGNQGIAATLPVVAVAEKLDIDEETMIRAVTLSHLITIYIKSKFGRLSAFCGVTVSGVGASCGIAYIMDKKKTTIKSAIQNMLGNVAGMICDGAKAGCALKVSSCTSTAVHTALMAIRGVEIKSTDGFIEKDVEKTINNFCQLGNEGSNALDNLMLNMMINK